ncbi:MAG: DJ-1 family glyoxalase III [Thermodesulfobacteriota bacterium]
MAEEVIIVLAPGFEEIEAVTIIDVLRRGGVAISSAGLEGREVGGAHGITIQADTTLESLGEQLFSGVILPGGMGGTSNLLNSEEVLALVKRHSQAGRVVAAICAAPWVLAKAQLLAGRQATIYPGLEEKLGPDTAKMEAAVVEDGQLITSQGPATAMDFALALVSRFAGAAKAREVARGLLAQQDS